MTVCGYRTPDDGYTCVLDAHTGNVHALVQRWDIVPHSSPHDATMRDMVLLIGTTIVLAIILGAVLVLLVWPVR